MDSRHSSSFGQWLTATGLLSDTELARAEAHRQSTGEHLPDTLVRMGLSTAEEVGQALARHLEIPYVGRDEFPASPPSVPTRSRTPAPRSCATLRRMISTGAGCGLKAASD